jgi:hypothetical protein
MFSSTARSSLALCALALPLLLAGCSTTPPAATRPPPPPPVPAAPPVVPVEAEPATPATQPAVEFIASTAGPVAAVLAYADKVRTLNPQESTNELQRLGDPGEAPLVQMQVALALAQTRNPGDLAKAQGLMQKVAANTSEHAQPLRPLARALGYRYGEQRRVEDDRDRQAQLVREAQKRNEQLTERLEALRAIERSFARPNNATPAMPAPKPPSP